MNGAVYIPFFQGQLESVLEQVVQLAVQEISSTVGSSLNALLLEAAVHEQENRRLRLRLQAWETRRGHDEQRREGQAAAGDESPDAGRTKPEQPAEPRGPSDGPTDSRRLEQRGRVVEQLKCAMERVVHSALCQLKKMVEASFDDLLLEITQKERERQTLQARLDRRSAATRREARDRSSSPAASEGAPEDCHQEPAKGTDSTGAVDAVDEEAFRRKWSGDVWKPECGASGERRSSEGLLLPPPVMTLTLDPLQDPRWTPLEEMDVLSSEHDAAPPPEPPLSPSGSVAVRSSASMLQRLLTASQLPDDHKRTHDAGENQDDNGNGDDGDDDDNEEEKWKKKKRRKIWSECQDCGRRFSRASLLKAHRQTHDTSDGGSPPQCSHCGKRFSSASRLHGHLRAKHQS
ncbi:uncharacterized protein si:dkeyp-113d7.10 [Corythoichthys intestinalis]|uniref:uncharacterized protein si:dkeyp-113d7.10 n=1 Tax=Corythoichthys intestinalis TaxID=161448 RepID=UPI0025A51419|nr:uncharacterized protein si:dkeyp-113d7.10 [Corythoichthys intestinalis]